MHGSPVVNVNTDRHIVKFKRYNPIKLHIYTILSIYKLHIYTILCIAYCIRISVVFSVM